MLIQDSVQIWMFGLFRLIWHSVYERLLYVFGPGGVSSIHRYWVILTRCSKYVILLEFVIKGT